MPEALDRELNLKGIVGFGIALVAATVLAAALMWVLTGFLRHSAAQDDPPLAILPEARSQGEPPAPQLQADPTTDLAILRRRESDILNHYAWVDETTGVIRVPIDVAMTELPELSTQADISHDPPNTPNHPDVLDAPKNGGRE